MKTAGIFLILCLLLLSSPGLLRAEWIDGEVKKVDLKAGTITVGEIDPVTETEETEEIIIDKATVFSGVKSLAEIRAEDDVSIETKYDEPTDSWKAISVEVPEAGD